MSLSVNSIEDKLTVKMSSLPAILSFWIEKELRLLLDVTSQPEAAFRLPSTRLKHRFQYD